MLPQWTVVIPRVLPPWGYSVLGGQNDGICVSPIVDRYIVSLERITHVLKTYIEN
jgi:hypothetical protein